MDETYIQLLAEIESLKSEIAELRMAQGGAENAGGASGAVGEMLVPIGQIGGQDVEIFTDVFPTGGSSGAKVLGSVKLTPFRDANNNADTNIKFDISEDTVNNETKTVIKIGVYYV